MKIGVVKIRVPFYRFLYGKSPLLYLCQMLPSIGKINPRNASQFSNFAGHLKHKLFQVVCPLCKIHLDLMMGFSNQEESINKKSTVGRGGHPPPPLPFPPIFIKSPTILKFCYQQTVICLSFQGAWGLEETI